MRKSKFTDEQIACALKQSEARDPCGQEGRRGRLSQPLTSASDGLGSVLLSRKIPIAVAEAIVYQAGTRDTVRLGG